MLHPDERESKYAYLDDDVAVPDSVSLDSVSVQNSEQQHVKDAVLEKDTEQTQVEQPAVGDAKESEEEKRDSQHDWGRVVIAKARELVRLFHLTIGHCVSLSAIQSMIRSGGLVVQGEAAVKKCILQMQARDMECLDCAKAATNRNHPKDHKSAIVPGMYIMDVSGKYWKSKRAFVMCWSLLHPMERAYSRRFFGRSRTCLLR